MRALVTGGGGFLGGAIVRCLLGAGHEVRSFARGDYPELTAAGVEVHRGDLSAPARDGDGLARAFDGCDAVFHVAAKAGVWGPYAEYHRVNVVATQRVLEGCRHAGVGKLIYTSTPSVVFAGRDIEGGDESLPYPPHYDTAYAATKAEAERLVLASDGGGLRTTALRPHLVWGPGDNHLAPRLVARARAGRLRRIGGRPCPVDSVYVDNAAEAHLLAAAALDGPAAAGGRAYFISNGEPLPVWELVERILAAAGAPPIRRTVSPRLAYAAGAVLEGVWRLLRLDGEPPMTRFVAHNLATAHWFDISAARRDLGYVPTVSIDEGMKRLAAWFALER